MTMGSPVPCARWKTNAAVVERVIMDPLVEAPWCNLEVSAEHDLLLHGECELVRSSVYCSEYIDHCDIEKQTKKTIFSY